MNLKYIIIPCIALLLASCRGEVQDFPLNIVVAEKLGESKHDLSNVGFKELFYPLEGCEDIDFVPQVKITRLGKKNKSFNLSNDEKSKAGNANNIRLYINRMNKLIDEFELSKEFIEDVEINNVNGLVEQFLTSPSLKNKQILFYTSNAAQDEEFKGKPIIRTQKEYIEIIKDILCEAENAQQIVVVILTDETLYGEAENEIAATPEEIETDSLTSHPDPIKAINPELEEILTNIGNTTLTFENRMDLIEPTLDFYFAEDAIIRVVGNDGSYTNMHTAKPVSYTHLTLPTKA